MSSPISRLPPELLLIILRKRANEEPLERVEPSDVLSTPRARQWSQFCLVSKSWLEWSEPELYREICLRLGSEHVDSSVSLRQTEHDVARLYQQLVTTPRLAAFVRYLNLQMAFLKTIEEQGALGYLLDHLPNLVRLELPRFDILSPILDDILDDLARRTPPLRVLGLLAGADFAEVINGTLARFERLEELRVLCLTGGFSCRFTLPSFQASTLLFDRSISPSVFLTLTFSSQSSLSSLCVAISASHPGYDLSGLAGLRSLTLYPHGRFGYPVWDTSDSLPSLLAAGKDGVFQSFRMTLSTAINLPNLVALELRQPVIVQNGRYLLASEAAKLVSAADLWSTLPPSLLYLNLDQSVVLSSDVDRLLGLGTLRFLHLSMVVDHVAGGLVGEGEKARLNGVALRSGQAIEWARFELRSPRVDAGQAFAAGVQGNPAPVQRNGQSRRGRRPWR
ncbi:hypothetical protein JCM8547_005623 [Rhodosporidiobolus lusitaniae]